MEAVPKDSRGTVGVLPKCAGGRGRRDLVGVMSKDSGGGWG